MARLFHFRKIKRLEIRRSIPPDELLRFLSCITRQFIHQGGAQAILRRENFANINLSFLIIPSFCGARERRSKEIWPYLLMEAVSEDDQVKLDQLAGTFEKVVGKFNTEDFIQNEELHKNFIPFFRYFRETAGEKYSHCARDLLKLLMSARKMPTESKFESLKPLISDLSERDLASTLGEEVIGNDKFDSLSFSIFTRIIDRDRHQRISTSLKELFHTDEPRNKRPEVEKKINALLSGSSARHLTDIYRQTLASLFSEISFDKEIIFDRRRVRRNYRFVLLNFLARDSQKEASIQYLERILEEWKTITEEQDLGFMLALLTVLQEKAGDLADDPVFEKASSSLSMYIEDSILQGECQPELEVFLSRFRHSIHDPVVYLKRIFDEKKVSSTQIKAYFTFFPAHLTDFLDHLKRKAADCLLLEKMVSSLM